MTIHRLERKQFLKSDIDEVWAFFSSPENLDELTPPDMGFDIITKRPIPKMFQGQLIDYKVRPILGIPLSWRTKITQVKGNHSFVDEQLKGPYALWKHTHTFIPQGDGVMMIDSLDYALPLGPIGNIVHSFYVKNKLKRIFDYRYDKVEELFNQRQLQFS